MRACTGQGMQHLIVVGGSMAAAIKELAAIVASSDSTFAVLAVDAPARDSGWVNGGAASDALLAITAEPTAPPAPPPAAAPATTSVLELSDRIAAALAPCTAAPVITWVTAALPEPNAPHATTLLAAFARAAAER